MRRLWRVLRAAGLVAMLACLSASVADAATLTMLWNRNPEADVIGYKFSWGTISGQYSTTIDVGNQLSYVLTGADPTIRYYFAVQAYNTSGLQSAYSTEVSWPTTPTVSLTAPAGGIKVSGSISVTASASDDVGVVGVQFMLDGTTLGAEDTTPPYSVSWNTAGVTTGSHTLTAIARDGAGNRTTSAPVIVTVGNDITPPVISAVTTASITTSSATINFTTNEPSSHQLEYGRTTSYGTLTALDTVLRTAHSQVLTNLAAGTLYHYRVRATDAAGNTAMSEDATFIVIAGGPGNDLIRVADLDGDHIADLNVFRPSTGTWFNLRSSASYTAAGMFQWGLPGDIPVSSDYDGDGTTDLAVFRPANGTWYISQSTTNFTASVMYPWGLPGDVPVPGDYDGDGKTDLAVFRPPTGLWYILLSSTKFTLPGVTYQWGLPGDVTVAGDYDGDGVTDLAVYRPSTGMWYVRLSTTGYATSAPPRQWGLPGDISVPGDYDGDGKNDPAVYRPSSGTWYILDSSTGYTTTETYQWGLGGDVPVPSDFDGDGKTDLAVFRPDNGYWFLKMSSTNFTTAKSYQWGLPGDIPILNRQ